MTESDIFRTYSPPFPPTRTLGSLNGNSPPTAADWGSARKVCHGIAPPHGVVAIASSANVTVTIWAWNIVSKKFQKSGASSATNQKLYDADALDCFVAGPGALCWIGTSGASTIDTNLVDPTKSP